jgi:hypothetical protein
LGFDVPLKDLLVEMSLMKNQGSACVAKRVVEDVAVVKAR